MPWGSLGSSRFVEFTRVRPKGHWVHPGRWVHSVAPWRSLGSSGSPLGSLGSLGCRQDVVGFIMVLPRGHWVFPGSLGSLVCVMGAVGFIRCHWVHSGASSGSLGYLGLDMGSSKVVEFTRIRPGSR